jgi:hypothetical protein
MIRLHLTNEAFEQDIRPLLKSFFPKEELVVSFGEVPEKMADGTPESEGASDFGRYLLAGDWREDGFTLSLYRSEDVTCAVQKEEKQVSFTERKKFRDEVKRAVYRMLSAETGKSFRGER